MTLYSSMIFVNQVGELISRVCYAKFVQLSFEFVQYEKKTVQIKS